MKPMLRSLKLLLVFGIALALFAVVPAPAQVKAETFYYIAYPKGTVGLKKPTVGFAITDTEVTVLHDISLKLDGQEVQGTFDPKSMSYRYTPAGNLSVGEHTVKVSVNFTGYEPIEQQWTFTVSPLAIDEPPSDYSDKQLELVKAVNDYRTLYGLPPLQINRHLTMAAKMHAEYLHVNQIDPNKVSLHDQSKSVPGYTGSTPGERAVYAGYYEGVAEDVSYNFGTPVESVDGLFDAPYHRIPFLYATVKEVGVAVAGPIVVLEFGFQDENQMELQVTPAPGDKYVPVAFEGNEVPDPIRMHTATASYPVGYPILARLTGADLEEVTLLDAKLTDAAGQPVELLRNSPKNDNHLKQEVILTPVKPLQPDSAYTAYVKLSASRNGTVSTFERKWDFRTEPVPTVGKEKLHQDAAAYKKLAELQGDAAHTVSFALNGDKYVLDGVTFDMHVAPAVVDGSAYLWVRDLASALGAAVTWDDAQKAAIYTKKDRTITFYTTRGAYAVNGREYVTGTAAKLMNDHTMIPGRLLSEVLGAKVEYVPETHSVSIRY